MNEMNGMYTQDNVNEWNEWNVHTGLCGWMKWMECTTQDDVDEWNEWNLLHRIMWMNEMNGMYYKG